MTSPVRIFVGCAANHEDIESQAVLEWSLRKHASVGLDITWMRLSRNPASPFYSAGIPAAAGRATGWDTSRWATPFSGFRWAIPALCGFTGRAIYCDSDVIFKADVAELWAESFAPGKVVVARGDNRICVSLWDCAAAANWLPSLDEIRRDPDSHRRLMSQVRAVAQPFATGKWNVLDRELPPNALGGPEVKAIHYTDMAAQPQLRHALPRLSAQGRAHWFDGARTPGKFPAIDALFDALLAEATANGYGPWRYAAGPPYGDYRKASLARGPKAVAAPPAQRRVGQN